MLKRILRDGYYFSKKILHPARRPIYLLLKSLKERSFIPLHSSRYTKSSANTACVLPWMHYYTSEMGHNFPCCVSTDVELPNIKLNGDKYEVYKKGQFEDAWNSRYMRDIRLKMLAGQRPEPCQRCYKFEDLGITSHRVYANRRWPQFFKLFKNTADDGSVPLKLYSADIRLGNQCNLRCRMCSPVSSKGLVADWQKMDRLGDHEAKEFLSMDWFEKPEFWNLFLKYSSHLESLHFAGGEPFLIKQHFQFLKHLIDQGVSKKLSLSYNTNMTVLPTELLELWKSFKEIHLMVSLDGMETVNHYIRYPANWKNIQKNLRYIHDNLAKYNVTQLNFNVTVQAYNIFDLPKLIDFIVEEYPNGVYPNLSLLFSPQELSVQVLPNDIKAQLVQTWSQYLEQRRDYWRRKAKWVDEAETFIQNVEGIIKFIHQEDNSDLFPKFKMRTRLLDKTRNQNCAESIPELATYFN